MWLNEFWNPNSTKPNYAKPKQRFWSKSKQVIDISLKNKNTNICCLVLLLGVTTTSDVMCYFPMFNFPMFNFPLRRISIQRKMSRDRLFPLAFFWNVFTDLYLITAIQKKVSGKSRSRDIFCWMEIRLYTKNVCEQAYAIPDLNNFYLLYPSHSFITKKLRNITF